MTEYTLDTNILVNMNRLYPEDIFPGLWGSLEDLVKAGRICICEEVLEELKRGGDELHSWAKGLQGFACPVSATEPPLVGQISRAHPGWVRGTTNAADPWLVAHALAHNRTIVTEERAAGHGVVDANQKVPNVAAEHGVDSMRFFDLARAEGWAF